MNVDKAGLEVRVCELLDYLWSLMGIMSHTACAQGIRLSHIKLRFLES